MDIPRIPGKKAERKRRVVALLLITISLIGGMVWDNLTAEPIKDNASTAVLPAEATAGQTDTQAGAQPGGQTLGSSSQKDGHQLILATEALGKLAINGRAPKTGFKRSEFGNGWAQAGTCSMRDRIMARDFAEVQYRSIEDCDVVGGILNDPYTAKAITFSRSKPSAVQIDHVIALSDAWQKGAQQLSPATRAQFANDPLELLAVDGPANGQKSDGDAATWLPANKVYRCRYVARQIAVKVKYQLWVTQAEYDAMARTLGTCPEQVLPIEQTLGKETLLNQALPE